MSFDDIMILCKGIVSFQQFIAMKPTKYGIKVWAVSSPLSGFIPDIEVYTGKTNGLSIQIQSAITSALNTFLDLGHTVSIENFFTSLNLTRGILQKKYNGWSNEKEQSAI